MSKSKSKKARVSAVGVSGEEKNEYQIALEAALAEIVTAGAFFSSTVEVRTKQWNKLDKLWDPLCEKYAWACPDNRALRVLCHFSPLIEIGAGKGYWASLLRQRGCDIVCFDKYGKGKDAASWAKVQQGGPEKLLEPSVAQRNLFLCFPDGEESIAIVCLENFSGEYVVHVGELGMSGDGTLGSTPQAPWGRTSSAEFQTVLSSTFHCVYIARLATRLPFGRDCISVWKRTRFVLGRNFPTRVDVDNSGEEEEEDDDEDDDESAAFNRNYFSNLHEQEKMLADRHRMDFYQAGINNVVKPGATVLDVGTGTGILAAFAEKRGAKKVYAVDHSGPVLKIAQKVAASNRLSRVEFIRKHTSEFRLKGEEKVDIILHEQMGDVLFDEDMVKNVCDVRDRLLKPGGRIFPSCFDLFVEPIKIDEVRHVPFIWDLNVHGIDFSCLRNDDKREDEEHYHLRSCDPRLVEFLLAAPEPVYSLDLHTLVEEDMPHTLTFSKTIVHPGQLDGFAVYFRARGGKDLTLSTGPHDPNRAPHWGFRILRDGPTSFKLGDVIEVTLSVGSWADLNSWRWSHQKKAPGGKKGSTSAPAGTAAGAVSTMSLSDLAKLRGEQKQPPPASAKSAAVATTSSSSAVSFMSIAELNKLRENQGGAVGGKRKSVPEEEEEEEEEQEEEDDDEEGEGSEEEEGEDLSTQQRREQDLDAQYEETNDKRWADIPAVEDLPCDRAIPSLQFLL